MKKETKKCYKKGRRKEDCQRKKRKKNRENKEENIETNGRNTTKTRPKD